MINALQHIGVGVTDVNRSYRFYRRHLGFKVNLGVVDADIKELEPIFGRWPHMLGIVAFNAYGGAALELMQHVDTPPCPGSETSSWGDIGLLELGIEVRGLERIYEDLLRSGIQPLTGVERLETQSGKGWKYVYLKDPDGLPIQLLDFDNASSSARAPKLFCGIVHVGVGVSDLESSVSFYREVLGFDQELYRGKDVTGGFEAVMPKPGELEIVILGRSAGSTARLASFTGGMVKIIHCRNNLGRRVLEGRRFGDPGIAKIGLDVNDVAAALSDAVCGGAKKISSPIDFNWGFGPRGTTAFLTDPEENILEIVELKKMFRLSPTALNWLVMKPSRLLARIHVL